MIWRQKSLETACLAAFDPPIEVHEPETLSSAVIFASPHSGNIYPEAFLSRSPLTLNALRKNEDAYINTLFAAAPDAGAPLLRARFPRCFVDVNRSADELPEAWVPNSGLATPRANMGLGVIPTIISENQPIYTRPLRPAAVKVRLKHLYDPYHDALRSLIDTATSTFGRALLIDCHSMPGFAPGGTRRADIILGDRYGTSCHPETIANLENLFTRRDYSVTRNHPYAGGYVTSHYGQPSDNVETVQIEINRDLYLNPVTLKPNRGYGRLEADLQDIIADITHTFGSRMLLAAE